MSTTAFVFAGVYSMLGIFGVYILGMFRIQYSYARTMKRDHAREMAMYDEAYQALRRMPAKRS
jgi:hypothetical protein